MLTVKRFANARIELRARDHDPPHCYVVFSDGRDVLVELSNLTVRGSISARMLREALTWIAEHQAELLEHWREMNP